VPAGWRGAGLIHLAIVASSWHKDGTLAETDSDFASTKFPLGPSHRVSDIGKAHQHQWAAQMRGNIFKPSKVHASAPTV
jgi:hypothetical protein